MSPTSHASSTTPAAGGAAPSSVQVREGLVEALNLDLIGPENGSDLAAEILPQAPSRWYLTGFLVPLGASPEQRAEVDQDEEVDAQDEGGAADDAQEPEPPSARRAFLPSSIGLSFLVSGETEQIEVTARWGDYKREGGEEGKEEGGGGGGVQWRRTPRQETVQLTLPARTAHPLEREVPGSGGLRLVLTVRPLTLNGWACGVIPAGTRAISLFLVNYRAPKPDDERDEAFAFQAGLEVRAGAPFVPRVNLRGLETKEWDEQVADLQYRDVCEYAVGHNIATAAELSPAGECPVVRTCWLPTAQVERVAPAKLGGVELGMEALAALASGAEARTKLAGLVAQYRNWIDVQVGPVPATPPKRKETGDELIRRARIAADRIESGIELLAGDAQTLEAFCIANRVMATAYRRRVGFTKEIEPAKVDAPAWRPFQLAFILLNLAGIADPLSHDREVVDLLFFPTGGGKTEAYLGLAAFTLVLRRLKNPGIASAGLSVLMRYTLRLLTLDQLGRAATLICALELEREKNPIKLGPWPFEIGLWVGRAATPNTMGGRGSKDPDCAYRKTIAFLNDDRKPSPIPLEECPWCGKKFTRNSFQLVPNAEHPLDLRVVCANRNCDFTRERALPILAVDEPIYRRLPCFMIATVDKFASMPWTGNVGAFFGRVERQDKNGFYGPCDEGQGQAMPVPLLPPELVIQDELHLISGPMGTMVGLYETALDELCSREVEGKKIRPKIIASTATVRRAESQIRAIFNRGEVDIFPPPGPNLRDSFFAKTHSPEESNARLYLGIVAQGRSPKQILLRTSLVLLGATQKAWLAAGGKRNTANPADPYMTLLGYFNSLRELGGCRRILEDEVGTRLTGYSHRRRIGQTDGLFADRRINYDVLELTSRVSTNKVAEARQRLQRPFHEDKCVDVAIATNMISVGLDIPRLGLMMVFGQPKTSAEYIQATSRVGREVQKPGLVVTLFNIHKPRDRSHYERFACYHQSFYRSVEATSVTPFSPRALDRGIAGTAVALARLGHRPMTSPKGATEILNERGRLDFVADFLAERARAHKKDMTAADAAALRQKVKAWTIDLLDTWATIAYEYQQNGTLLQYQKYESGGARPLIYDMLDPELKLLPLRHRKFRANRSMRDVEPGVNLWMRTLDGMEVAEEDEV